MSCEIEMGDPPGLDGCRFSGSIKQALFADAERRIYLTTTGAQNGMVRREPRLIGITDALQRYDAWRAPKERQTRCDFWPLISGFGLGVFVGT
jgi:hypothetical protein